MSRRRDAEAKLIEEALANVVINPVDNIKSTDKIISDKFKTQ
jgi:hypothetical protein